MSCTSCKNEIKCTSLGYCIVLKKKGKSQYQKAKEGKVQITIMREKILCFKRDGGRCIYCNDIATDAHHVFFRNSERRLNDKDRNSHKYQVALCRSCHQGLTDGNRILDLYCRKYLFDYYKNEWRIQ